jgi:type I restriction enzyme S subunit
MHELLTGQIINSTWESKRLEEVATISRGGSPRPIESYLTDDSDGLNWLRIGDIDVADKYIYRTTDKIKREGLKKTTQVQIGDLILSNSMSFGRPYIMKIDACIHDGWLAFKNISKEIKTEYLYYILSSDKTQSTFYSLAMGSGVKNLKRESVSSIEIKFPEIDEQNKILAILSSVDEKISINKKLKEKLILFKKGLMQNLLSGNKRVKI